MDVVNEFLRYGLRYDKARMYNPIKEHIECADGFTMSVQANRNTLDGYIMHYAVWSSDKWVEVEIGYPRFGDDPWVPLQLYDYTDSDTPKDCGIFGWVPVAVVEKIIHEHGGMVNNLQITPGSYYRYIY